LLLRLSLVVSSLTNILKFSSLLQVAIDGRHILLDLDEGGAGVVDRPVRVLSSQLLGAALLPLAVGLLRGNHLTLLGAIHDNLRLPLSDHLLLLLLALPVASAVQRSSSHFNAASVAEGGGVDGGRGLVARLAHVGHGYFVHWDNVSISSLRRMPALKPVSRTASFHVVRLVASRSTDLLAAPRGTMLSVLSDCSVALRLRVAGAWLLAVAHLHLLLLA